MFNWIKGAWGKLVGWLFPLSPPKGYDFPIDSAKQDLGTIPVPKVEVGMDPETLLKKFEVRDELSGLTIADSTHRPEGMIVSQPIELRSEGYVKYFQERAGIQQSDPGDEQPDVFVKPETKELASPELEVNRRETEKVTEEAVRIYLDKLQKDNFGQQGWVETSVVVSVPKSRPVEVVGEYNPMEVTSVEQVAKAKRKPRSKKPKAE